MAGNTRTPQGGMTTDTTISARFAEYATSLAGQSIPQATRHNATRCILDWYAGTIAGGILPPATLLAAGLAATGQPQAALLPSGERTDARTAALINGAASHTVEVDDIYSPGLYHPGSPVISAAVAVAEAEAASGRDLVTAVIAGYEVSNRIARTVNPAHYTYWHTTATVGHFGAAVAAGLLLKLDAAQLAHALTTVTSFAAGLRHAFASDAMGKAFHVGRAAEAGVLGAIAAKHGVTGVPDMLEGERGFATAMSRDVDWEQAFTDLGDFTIDRTTQKAHACCGHTFAAIDATQDIVRREGLAADDITSIKVGTYSAGVEICANRDPQTPYEAKFSLPYTVALAALGRHTGPSSFSDAVLHDTALRDMMAKTSYYLDERCQAVFPKLRSAYVDIETSDGRVFSQHQPSRRGDPADPLSDEALSEKFAGLVGPVLGEQAAAQLLAKLWQLDGLAAISDVRVLATRSPEAVAAE
jgi:2-methylcitrate dehydratase PrpD